MNAAMLKIVWSWGTLKSSDLTDYVPGQISVEDFKNITGEEYKAEG